MKEIDKLFNKTIKKLTKPEVILEQYLKEEFKKINISLTKLQLKKIIKQILPLEALGSKKTLSLQIDVTDKQLSKAGYSNEKDSLSDIKKIFNNLPAGVEDNLKNIIDKFPKIMEGAANDSAKLMLDNILKELDLYLAPIQYQHHELTNNIDYFWGYSIDLLQALTAISLESGESYYKENVKIKSNNNCTYEVLFRLHAKACQISSEIVALLRAGFADGALARWRTLHEISIVSFFISEHGNDLAERYLDYQIIDSYKAALQFQVYAEKIDHKKMSDSRIAEFLTEVKVLDEKYGTHYKKGSYGWAAEALKIVKPTFRDIEESISLDHLRPYYKMASYNVHASSKGLYFNLGLNNDDNTLLAGPSNLGFVDPCIFTALSLYQITSNLLLNEVDEVANMDVIVVNKVMLELKKLIEKEVGDAEESILSQERE